ncbi:MAG: DUF120 domain-containing protein [Limnochorda sp.]|uniref:DUF120 domain-containing protein n=1 Tax=Limnochorda TaxID=1676651 RepID=UPI0026ED0D13|nr:DUF120 domain-containing protein [Limnochorda pilosa]
MEAIIVHGRVATGAGRASSKVFASPARRASASTLLGMEIFPGTLNVVVETPLHFRRSAMIRWEGWKNTIWYCPARLNGRKVFLHDWKTRPRSRLEIVADIKLRDAFGLTDGDPVEVWIPSEYLAHVGHLSRWQRFKLDHQATWEAVAKVLRQLNTGLRFPSTRRPGDADAG